MSEVHVKSPPSPVSSTSPTSRLGRLRPAASVFLLLCIRGILRSMFSSLSFLIFLSCVLPSWSRRQLSRPCVSRLFFFFFLSFALASSSRALHFQTSADSLPGFSLFSVFACVRERLLYQGPGSRSLTESPSVLCWFPGGYPDAGLFGVVPWSMSFPKLSTIRSSLAPFYDCRSHDVCWALDLPPNSTSKASLVVTKFPSLPWYLASSYLTLPASSTSSFLSIIARSGPTALS